MLSLPSDVTTHQISFLCPQGILNFGATCRHFYKIVHQDLTLAILGKEQFALPIEKATASFNRFIASFNKRIYFFEQESKDKKTLHKFRKCLHYFHESRIDSLSHKLIRKEAEIEEIQFSIYCIFLLDSGRISNCLITTFHSILEGGNSDFLIPQVLHPILKRLNLFNDIEIETYLEFLHLTSKEDWKTRREVARTFAKAYGEPRPLSIMERLTQGIVLDETHYRNLEESLESYDKLKLFSVEKVAKRRSDFNQFIDAAVLELKEKGFFTAEEYNSFIDQWVIASTQPHFKDTKKAFEKFFTLPIKVAVILKAIKEDKQSIIEYLSNHLDSFSYMELLLLAKKDDHYLGLSESGIVCVSNFKIATLLKFAQDSGHSHFVTRISNELLSPQSIKKGRELLEEFVNEFPKHPFSSRVNRALREADIRDGMTPIRNVWDQAREILASISAAHNQKKL
jgi:hypothetical protein